jgi:hypothetical protein
VEWFSIIFAAAALLISILSPLITGFINNRHEMKMYRLRTYAERRNQCWESYIIAAGACLLTRNNKSDEYTDAYSKIFAYAPESVWPKIEFLDACIAASEFPKARSAYKELCAKLAPRDPAEETRTIGERIKAKLRLRK